MAGQPAWIAGGLILTEFNLANFYPRPPNHQIKNPAKFSCYTASCIKVTLFPGCRRNGMATSMSSYRCNNCNVSLILISCENGAFLLMEATGCSWKQLVVAGSTDEVKQKSFEQKSLRSASTCTLVRPINRYCRNGPWLQRFNARVYCCHSIGTV